MHRVTIEPIESVPDASRACTLTRFLVAVVRAVSVAQEIFEDSLREIQDRYTMQTYNLLSHNCNNFSDEVLQFLTGSGLPPDIVNLPSEVMDSPLGAMIAPLISQFEAALNQPGGSRFT